ncbi:MAG: hypothetical protein AABZ39_07820 [Spirochaetota bacterium]
METKEKSKSADIRGLSWAETLLREREQKLEAESAKHRQDIFFKKMIPFEEYEDMRRQSRQ